ncbi:MAG: exo-alpha-sialidase, partial [Akkermansia sp.]|nr:exo-alpha-sialidase [Akkermansia sp.]
MLKNAALFMLLCCGAFAAESFESLPAGAFTSRNVEYGVLTAPAGHAEILSEHARTGKQALHIKGGDKREVRLKFSSPLEADTVLSFWLERWTKRNPFRFELIAETSAAPVSLVKIEKMSVGRYKQHVTAVVPRGAHSVVLRCASHKQGGALVDDLLLDNEEMQLGTVKELPRGAYPMLKRAPINPVVGYELSTSGSLAPCQVKQLRMRVHPASAVEEITLRSGNAEGTDFRNSIVFGKAKPAADGTVVVTCNEALKPGVNRLWVDATPSADSVVGGTVRFEPVGMLVDDKEVDLPAEPVSQNIGYFVAYPDEPVGNQPDGAAPRKCVSFRIPGLIRTASGALVGCFDARYLHSADLCADIDVAVVRSEDGGQTWTAPAVGMDAGPGADNGCG